MRNLAIVERAGRGAIEEQYADILWLCRVLMRMRLQTSVLLRGNAVSYAVRKPEPITLDIAGQRMPAVWQHDRSVADLLREGVPVYVSDEDCGRLAIANEDLVPGVVRTSGAGIAQLCHTHDRIWYW